jgi:catechol-2,3-dioxygenase
MPQRDAARRLPFAWDDIARQAEGVAVNHLIDIAAIRLQASALDEQRAFYRLLDLPVIDETATTITFAAGETSLAFAEAPSDLHPVYHFAFNIPENKIDSALEWCRRRFALIVRPGDPTPVHYFANWNAHALYFFDPAGNIVELIARHTLGNARDGAFSAADILRVSEIGLVTPDVAATTAWLREQLGAEVYHDSAVDFAAVGNERGLFIVSRIGRCWMPTNEVPAEQFETGVWLRGGGARALSVPDTAVRIVV